MRTEFTDRISLSGRPLKTKSLTGRWRIVRKEWGDTLEIEQRTMFGTKWIPEYLIDVQEVYEFDCGCEREKA